MHRVLAVQHYMYFYRPRSEGDNVLGSVRPSVRPCVCLGVPRAHVCLSELSCLNRLTYETKMKITEKSHYQSEVFVCVLTI